MPRPSKRNERSAEILDAYEVCIARYGVDGATLERVAEEAGLARALIRHNVGNKDEMFAAFLARFMDKYNQATTAMFDALPDSDRIQALIDWLFDPRYANPHGTTITNALMIAANDRPDLAEQLQDWADDFTARILAELRYAYPEQDTASLQAAATGITALYFNYESGTPLGENEKLRRSSKHAAELLVRAID